MRWQTFQELKDEWEAKDNAELFQQERTSWQRLQLAELLFDIREVGYAVGSTRHYR